MHHNHNISNVNQMYKSEASSGHVSTYGNVDQVDAGLQLSKAELQKRFQVDWAPDSGALYNWAQDSRALDNYTPGQLGPWTI